MQTPNAPSRPTLLVACLCADWCGTCRDYQQPFAQLQEKFPNVHFLWIDVEDESDLVDPIEVENFPTLLIATSDRVLFFGTVTPHLETLQRLIRTHQASDAARALSATADVDSLSRRFWQRTSGKIER